MSFLKIYNNYILAIRILEWLCIDILPLHTVEKKGFLNLKNSHSLKNSLSMPLSVAALDDAYAVYLDQTENNISQILEVGLNYNQL